MNISQKSLVNYRSLFPEVALIVTMLTPVNLYSASQGSFGQTSSASMTITLSVPPKLEALIASEIPVNNPETPTTALANSPVSLCVVGKTITSYTVTASGHLENGAFTLQNGASLVPYDIMLSKYAGAPIKKLISGQPSESLKALTKNEYCESSAQIGLETAQPLDYNQVTIGAINLTISPE